jgi:hypothetical protein
MNPVRICEENIQPGPCFQCCDHSRAWDRIAGTTMCPNCQEKLAAGEAQYFRLPVQKRICAACSHEGVVLYMTWTKKEETYQAIEIDLCGRHVKDMIGRCLDSDAFRDLEGQLNQLGVDVSQVFLLHGAFYDGAGQALQPVVCG